MIGGVLGQHNEPFVAAHYLIVFGIRNTLDQFCCHFWKQEAVFAAVILGVLLRATAADIAATAADIAATAADTEATEAIGVVCAGIAATVDTLRVRGVRSGLRDYRCRYPGCCGYLRCIDGAACAATAATAATGVLCRVRGGLVGSGRLLLQILRILVLRPLEALGRLMGLLLLPAVLWGAY